MHRRPLPLEKSAMRLLWVFMCDTNGIDCDEICLFTDAGVQCVVDTEARTDNVRCLSDGDSCTADKCVNNVCEHIPLEQGEPCDDGDACTQNSLCNTEGECIGVPIVCDDGDPCTDPICDPDIGCQFPEKDPLPPACLPDAGSEADGGGDGGVFDGGNTGGTDSGADGGGRGQPPIDGATEPREAILSGGGCSCQAGNSTTAPNLWILALIMTVLARRKRGLLTIIGLFVGMSSVHANGFDSQIYRPVTSFSGYFTQDSAQVLPGNTVHAGATLHWADDVLVLRDPDTGEVVDNGVVVDKRTVIHAHLGLGAFGFLELGADVPIVLDQKGTLDGVLPQEQLSSRSMGDLRLFGKTRLLRLGSFRVGLAADLLLPTGNAESFVGSAKARFAPRLILGLDVGRFSLAVNGGYLIRDSIEIAGLHVDDEIFGGIGASLAIVRNRLWILGEGYFAYGFRADSSEQQTPTEAVGGIRARVYGPWVIQAGVGAGITHGYGAPRVRTAVTVAYASQRVQSLGLW